MFLISRAVVTKSSTSRVLIMQYSRAISENEDCSLPFKLKESTCPSSVYRSNSQTLCNSTGNQMYSASINVLHQTISADNSKFGQIHVVLADNNIMDRLQSLHALPQRQALLPSGRLYIRSICCDARPIIYTFK